MGHRRPDFKLASILSGNQKFEAGIVSNVRANFLRAFPLAAAKNYATMGTPFDILGLSDDVQPRQAAALVVHRANGSSEEVALILRIDTPIEVEYYRAGGILPYVLQEILRGA